MANLDAGIEKLMEKMTLESKKRFEKVMQLAPFDLGGDIDTLQANQVREAIPFGKQCRPFIAMGVLQKFNEDVPKAIQFLTEHACPFAVPQDPEALRLENIQLKSLLWRTKHAIEYQNEDFAEPDEHHNKECSKRCIYVGPTDEGDLYCHFCHLPWSEIDNLTKMDPMLSFGDVL